MWMLSFIPDALLHAIVVSILFTGVGIYTVSFFTRFIPPLIPYASLTRIIGTVLIVCGIYFYGSYSTEMSWRNRVSELEAKVKFSEEKSKSANAEIRTVYIDKLKDVKESQVVIQERIKEVEKRMDAQCVVIPEAINILNDAAKAPAK